jgi:hypothetical protein
VYLLLCAETRLPRNFESKDIRVSVLHKFVFETPRRYDHTLRSCLHNITGMTERRFVMHAAHANYSYKNTCTKLATVLMTCM